MQLDIIAPLLGMEVFTAVSQTVRTVERALDILLCFTWETPELTMTQIAEQIGIHKSTVHRILGTLEEKRFVERDEHTGYYRPGIQFLKMAHLAIERNDLRQLAYPFMLQLCEEHLETITLCKIDTVDVIYLDVIESPQRVKLAAAPGQRLPAHCTASGKAMLAFTSDESVNHILGRGMTKHTSYTLDSPEILLENLRLTRERGFAISVQEFEEGISAVAAPILDHKHRSVAAIAVAGPSYRLTQERMIEIGSYIRATADQISAEYNS